MRGAGSSVAARDRRQDLLTIEFAAVPLSYGHQREGERSCGCLTENRPLIDTNMRRVLHRVFVGPDVPEPAAKEPALLALAEKLVPPEGNNA